MKFLTASLEKLFVAYVITYLIPHGLVFQRKKKKDYPFSSWKHKLSRRDAQYQITGGTNCLDLSTQKYVASLNTAVPSRAGDNSKTQTSAKNRQKSKSYSHSVVGFFKTRSSPFHNVCEKHIIHQGNYTEFCLK